MSPQEVMSLLVQHGLFDVAFEFGRSLQLPLDRIYDNLTARWVCHLQTVIVMMSLLLLMMMFTELGWLILLIMVDYIVYNS